MSALERLAGATDAPVLLAIMDGVGEGAGDAGDAVHLAHTPVLDDLRRGEGPGQAACRLAAHGTAVGMPSDKDMGNSEVGHNALGAGRVVDQGAKLVANAIASGALFRTRAWDELMAAGRAGTLHLLGLLSDGNVHSHIDHLEALVRGAMEAGVQRVRVHVLLDGRDVPEGSAETYVERLSAFLAGFAGRDCRIASGGGRMHITMDRYEADWAMVARGWAAHVHGEARRFPSARAALAAFRAEGHAGDQHLPAFVVAADGAPIGRIEDGDGVLLWNFRGDRAVEITRAFVEEGLATFDRGRRPRVCFAGMMQYDGDLELPKRCLVDPPVIDRPLGELLAGVGLTQWACSETYKFGHVTYFWNGNRSGVIDPATETWQEIESDLAPLEERPWMKAAEITDAAIAALDSGRHQFLRLNYANGDMVGHTGHLEAARLAVSCVDSQLARLRAACLRRGATLIVTADHGNADDMWLRGKDGGPKLGPSGPLARTSHTLAPVPCCFAGLDPRYRLSGVTEPGLANLGATILTLLGYRAPASWEPSLLSRSS